MGAFRTHYDNLQVAETAGIEVIKGAYKFLTQKWHPDKHPDNRAGAERIMRIINDAYEVLSDPEKRQAHDAWIAEKRAKQAKPEQDAKQSGHRRHGPQGSDDSGEFVDDPDVDARQWEVPQKPEDTKAHSPLVNALSRFTARMIDLYLFVLILGAIAASWPEGGLQLQGLLENRVAAGILAVMLWIPMEAFFLYAFGGTPGKWLLGIDVQKRSGESLNVFDALQRSIGVAVLGMAGGIPPLFVFTNFIAFKRYLTTHSTIWDESLSLTIKYRKWTPLHLTSAALVIVIMLGLVIKSQIDLFLETPSGKAESVQKYTPVDTDIPGLQVSNECEYTIKMALSYTDLSEQQRTEGWWYVEPGASLRFTDDKGHYLKTRNDEWYFYSSIVQGPAFTWDGEHKYRFFDSVLPMQKVESENGERSWAIKCPGAARQAAVVAPGRESIHRKRRAVNDKDACVIKGIMTNEELANCRSQ